MITRKDDEREATQLGHAGINCGQLVGRNAVPCESTAFMEAMRRLLVRVIGKGVAHEDEIRDPLTKPVVV